MVNIQFVMFSCCKKKKKTRDGFGLAENAHFEIKLNVHME